MFFETILFNLFKRKIQSSNDKIYYQNSLIPKENNRIKPIRKNINTEFNKNKKTPNF